MSQTPTLRRKLFLARKAAEAIEKKGENETFHYTYARAEDVLKEAQRVLEKQGVLIIPSIESVEFKMGKSGTLALVSMTFEVVDTKGGESFTKPWAGTGFDWPGDKAVYAAITGGTKYFLASLLGIPFGVDPEDEPAPVSTEKSDVTQIRNEQDRAAEAPDLRPVSDLPAPDLTPAHV